MISRWRSFITLLTLCLVALFGACQGTDHLDGVARADFTNGTPRHPAAYDALWTQLQDCMWGKLGDASHVHVPLDSAVRSWVIVDHPDDKAAACPKALLADGGSSGCWVLAKKEIRIVLPAIAYPRIPMHEMGHAGQVIYPEWSDRSAPDPSHGEPLNSCASGV